MSPKETEYLQAQLNLALAQRDKLQSQLAQMAKERDEAHRALTIRKAAEQASGDGFPSHECGLYLEHNAHKDFYRTLADVLSDNPDEYDWPSHEAKTRAIETDELWVLQWYPNTPVSFLVVAAPTLMELLEFALTTEKGTGSGMTNERLPLVRARVSDETPVVTFVAAAGVSIKEGDYLVVGVDGRVYPGPQSDAVAKAVEDCVG